MLSQLQLEEPVVTGMVSLLSQNLPDTIDALNSTVTDGYTVDHPAQYLPVMPVRELLEAGTPVIGVAEMSIDFQDDLQIDMDARHEFVVVSVVQHPDYQTLAWQLRRLTQAVASTIQQDRLAGTPTGTASVMKLTGGLWSVNFVRSEPGPLLGDVDPVNPGAPPRAWLSWTGLVFQGVRKEINASG